MDWQLQDAKNKFSEVVRRAKSEGPQTVTVRGRREAVLVSAEAFDALVGKSSAEPPKKMSLVEFLTSGPPWDDEMVEIINTRDKTPPKDIEW